jgi:hypothetical protein
MYALGWVGSRLHVGAKLLITHLPLLRFLFSSEENTLNKKVQISTAEL